MQLAPMEERYYYRVRRDLEASYTFADSEDPEVLTRAKNISVGGLRININREVPDGKKLRITLCDKKIGIHLVLCGTVAWTEWNQASNSYDAGIQFAFLEQDHLDNVMALVGSERAHQGKQRRLYVRLKTRFVVSLVEAGGLARKKMLGSLLDLGFVGMAVVVDQGYKVGAILNTEVFVSKRRRPAKAKARVVSVTQHEKGRQWLMRLQFVELRPEAREKLGTFLSQEVQKSVLG